MAGAPRQWLARRSKSQPRGCSSEGIYSNNDGDSLAFSSQCGGGRGSVVDHREK